MPATETRAQTTKRLFKLLPQVLVAGIVLAGCSSTIHKKTMIDGIHTLSIDAKQRLVLVNQNGGPNQDTRVTCAEPSPDALVAQAAALSANLTTPKSIGAAIGAANKEAAGSIGLRTQTIQILRDGYYRICEAYMNGSITADKYREVISGIDGFITVVAAIESLGGTVQAPAITLSPSGLKTTANGDGASTDDAVAASVNIAEIKQAEGTLSQYQAAAIAEVVARYLEHKVEIARFRQNQGK